MPNSGFFARYKEFNGVTERTEDLGERYICYIHFSKEKDVMFLGVTNGISVWRSELTEDDIESYRINADLPSKEAYLSQMKTGLQSADIRVSILSQNLTLNIGSGPDGLTFSLFETTSQQKKEELQRLLFELSDCVKNLQKDLKDRDEKLLLQEKEKQKQVAENVSPFKDPGVKRPRTVPKPRQGKGHSVINPGSKRKQVAKGVEFE